MRKRNGVKQLNRVASHRKAMLRNMVTSLFEHERITTTRARAKVIRSYAEKLITRAKENQAVGVTPERVLHNKRELLTHLREREILTKLCEDIAPRFQARQGGYLRIIHLPERLSDGSQMSIVELVDRKEKPRRQKAAAASTATATGTTAESSAKSGDGAEKPRQEGKWYWKFKKNRES